MFPGPTLPFGMGQLGPDTEDRGYGYHYGQMSIQGFSMTHMSGAGCANDGEAFFTASTGPVKTQVWRFPVAVFTQRRSNFTRLLSRSPAALGCQCRTERDQPQRNRSVHISCRNASEHPATDQPHAQPYDGGQRPHHWEKSDRRLCLE